MSQQIFGDAIANYGAQLSAYGARTAHVLGAAEVYTIPKGFWRVETDAHVKTQFTYNSGSNYVDEVPISVVRSIFSDGTSSRALADGTGGTVTLTQIKAMF